MVSNKNNKKAKKPVETTLGKAPSKPKEKDTDLSHQRKPIETSICGIKQVLSLLETATNEVKNFVMYECDIMYECRICRSIFRSLANFILHKRNYCREKINPLDYIINNDTYQENIYMSEEKSPSRENKSLNKVIEKLQEMDHVRKLAKNVLTADLSSESSNYKVNGMDDREERSANVNEIVLEKIDTNSSGVFQTFVGNSSSDCTVANSNKSTSTKLEVMEIHKIVENDVPVLDLEGKICGFTSNKLHQTSMFPKSEFSCIECNHRFASQKSLTNHIKCIHNPSRIVYVCPTCKDTFANPWCVYRHLLKVHRMTNKQVRRMREQVHNSWIRRGEESAIQKKKPPEMNQGEVNSENQWINDIEGDNDFQMCAGCGKHFERKAALHSHSQMCAKRLEVCNNIKENAKKKEVEEAIEKAKLEKTANEKPLVTGAAKRKGQSIWSYQRKPKDIPEMKKKLLDSQESDILNLEDDAIQNSDFLSVIPDMLTPKASPSKNEDNSPLSPIINKLIQQKQQNYEDLTIPGSIKFNENMSQKQQNHEDLKIPESIRNEENITRDQHDYDDLKMPKPKENITQKQQNLEDLKITESIRNEDNITHETFTEIKDTESTGATEEVPKVIERTPENSEVNIETVKDPISVDTSNIKTEQSEDDNDINSDISDVENTDLISNTKSEAISSGENSRSSSSLSVKSTKSVASYKVVKSSLEENSRPRSDSFVRRNEVSNAKSETSFSANNSLPGSNSFMKRKVSVSNTKFENPLPINKQEENVKKASLKTFAKSSKLVSNIRLEESSSEEHLQRQLNPFSRNRNSEFVVSDNIDDNSDTLLQDNHDLLSNEITFEMFCKKVANVGRSSKGSKKLEINKRSTRLLRKRRRLTGSVERSNKLTTMALKSPDDDDDDDDDVIFVGETLDQKINDTSLPLENGFAGFSNEETSQVSYSVDLSNLSYNNPLKCKQKEGPNDRLGDSFEDTGLPYRKPMKRKSRKQSINHRSTVSKHEENEFNFILRAAPYMNRVKLLCIPCGLAFKSFNLLLWHMSAHFSWFRFQCCKCSFITFNKYDCMSHARKQHKLKENSAANFILPLPNWKTVSMSHEFRLLKDCNDLQGKHTDEKIGIDESQDQYIEDSSEILEYDAILFGESSKSSEDNSGIVIEKENVKKRNKSGKTVIDIQETIKDLQKLPEPVELAMPADVSEVIRTFSFDESTSSPDEAGITFDILGEESNDDWGLPKDGESPDSTKSNVVTTEDSDRKNIVKDEKSVNMRPSRLRTKVKLNDDFVYYDNDINNVLKSTDFFKSSPQKHRTDSVLTVKSRISGKSVPTTQKKKI